MQFVSRFVLCLAIVLLASGCATRKRGGDIAVSGGSENMIAETSPGSSQVDDGTGDDDDGDAIGTPVAKNEMNSEQVQASVSREYHAEYGELNLKVNGHVQKWINYFQGRGRSYMEVYLQRSSRYLPMMKATLREQGLPEDLVYIALIESGFSPMAHSHASAVGYWQFIKGTGRRYGLNVNHHIDERRDPVLSTRAAAEYFKALYNLFGSWYLAMASYNVGENRVKNVVMKHYTRDFWELVRKRKLPAETLDYVPKFIAAAVIAKNPEQYGFTNIPYQPALAYDTVPISQPISLDRLASSIGVPYEELKLLNPRYKTDYVPLYQQGETVVRVPVGTKAQAIASLPACLSVAPKVMVGEYDYYRVRSGDSLSTIARRHRTSVDTIRRLNNLNTRTMIRVGQRIKVPERIMTGGGEKKRSQPKSTNTMQARAIAKVAQMQEQTKRTPTRSVAAAKPTVKASKAAKKTKKVHVVKRGETLLNIAKSYKVTLNQLIAVNDLKKRQPLFVGKQLVIPVASR